MKDTNEQMQQATKPNGEAARIDPAATNGAAPAEALTEAPEQDMAAVIAERDAYLEQLQRSRADLANFRRRTEQERAQIREIANQVLLAQLLPVLDDLQRALAAVPDDQRETPLVQGLSLIERKFWAVLERAGVTPIDAVGQPFDPALHEAVDSVPGTAADTVVDVYQPGYRLGQGLLRPAMVKVGDRPAEPAADGRRPAEGDDTRDSEAGKATKPAGTRRARS